MTGLHKAATMALEALENSIDDMRHLYETDWRKGLPTRATQLAAMKAELDKHEAAITALREALAAPVVPEVPHGVHHAAKMFVKSDYRGPLARAKLVFDWVASLTAAPQPKDKP